MHGGSPREKLSPKFKERVHCLLAELRLNFNGFEDFVNYNSFYTQVTTLTTSRKFLIKSGAFTHSVTRQSADIDTFILIRNLNVKILFF